MTQGLFIQLLVSDSDHPHAMSRQMLASRSVVIDDLVSVVDMAIHFDRKLELRAIKVDDESIQHYLAAELDPSAAPGSKQIPRHRFGIGLVLSEAACEFRRSGMWHLPQSLVSVGLASSDACGKDR
ncbi:MAG TPA: hypothetical protein VFI39_12475 [Gemmatimonadales bacterium]|nr:hypothetical protein [Gemmatimonadales bacterium]